MENNDQAKEGREGAPQEKEGLQKPVPVIFEGITKPERSAGGKIAGEEAKPKEKMSGKTVTDVINKIFKRAQSKPTKDAKDRQLFFRNKNFALIIVSIFALAAFLSALSSFSMLDKEKKNRQVLSEKVSELVKKEKGFQASLANKAEELKGQQEDEQGPAAADKPAGVSAEDKGILEQLEQDKNALIHKNNILIQELSKAKDTIEGLRQDLEDSQGGMKELEKKVDGLTRDRNIIKAKLKRMNIDIAALEQTKDAGDLEAKILLVEQNNQIVAIDIGEIEGVKPGMEFDIYQQGELYGRIKIDQVQDTVSLGKIVPGIGIGRMMEGMKAKRRRI